jgi:hypothetical protein
MKFDFFQVKVSLQQLGFLELPASDSLGHQFLSTFLRDFTGYKRLVSFLDSVGRCRPFDPRFPFTPVSVGNGGMSNTSIMAVATDTLLPS